MSVRYAGETIREARKKAGLTQEQLSDGICTLLSISRIENGITGVSPSTFQALMNRAGTNCEVIPVFANRIDFNCFYILKKSQFYLDSWQLSLAHTELKKIEDMNWSENKIYYQEWLLLQNQLQLRSGCKNYSNICNSILDAISITRPCFSASNISGMYLSVTELRLCILLAQTTLFLGDTKLCNEICKQISDYLSSSSIACLHKELLLAENAIAYSMCLLAMQNYQDALDLAEYHRHNMAVKLIDTPLYELTFVVALCHYYLGNHEMAIKYFTTVFYSAHSIESSYATICKQYFQEQLQISLPEHIIKFNDIPLITYPAPKGVDYSSFGEGLFDIFSPDIITIGCLIHQLRVEQKITLETLCFGLCSKSKLSKIENNQLQPEIILAQTLLQRLGISDLVFSFFGSKRESLLQDTMGTLKKMKTNQKEDINKLTEKLASQCNKKDSLYLQYALFKKSNRESNVLAQIDGLQTALDISVPNFTLHNIHNYRLSHNELTILNNLGAAHYKHNPVIGIQYFYKLLDYLKENTLDVLTGKRIIPVTIGMLAVRLYVEKRSSEIIELYNVAICPEMKSSLYFTGLFYSHYCQALWQNDKTTETIKYANYAYHNLLISENIQAADSFKADLLNEFGVTLL